MVEPCGDAVCVYDVFDVVCYCCVEWFLVVFVLVLLLYAHWFVDGFGEYGGVGGVVVGFVVFVVFGCFFVEDVDVCGV